MDEKTRGRVEQFGKVGFDKAFPGIQLVEAQGGRARVRLLVSPEVQNINGTLHGGAIATLVDNAGTMAIISADRDGRPGVTTDLNVSYFAPGTGGEHVVAEAQVLKTGKTLAFVTVDIRREKDNVLVAQGRMTKYMA
ncbi:MAG: PaaI family thioesterase [Myxococcota bacterium]